jgi:hypothetical protein
MCVPTVKNYSDRYNGVNIIRCYYLLTPMILVLPVTTMLTTTTGHLSATGHQMPIATMVSPS